MKRTLLKSVLKKQNTLFFLLLLSWSTTYAQGYIDCATILADDDDYNLSNNNDSPVKIINGYTYIATHTTGYGTQQLPVVNGEGYHNTSGNDAYDSYIAVFAPNCNQILGTYLGGESGDNITVLEVDTDGNIIVAGFTQSTDFPTTDGTAIVGTYSTFVTKYAPDGTVLFSSVLPTAYFESPAIVVDGTDYYILGGNRSATFPTTDGSTLGGTENGFVAKYDANNNLVYLTQSGATGTGEYAKGFVLNGDLYVLGESTADFPTTDGTTIAGSNDVVLIKYDPAGNVVFSTVYGGDATDLTVDYDIITDGNAIYIASATTSDDFPTTDGSASGGVYLRKYDLNGNLVFSKLFSNEIYSSESYDMQYVNNALYMILKAESGLPVVGGTENAGGGDAYLIKLDTDGNIIFSTYYGGTGTDQPSDFYVNTSGEVYFLTWSTNALTTDGTSGTGTSIVKLNADGSLCAASHLNDRPFNFFTERFNVIGDTVYIVNAVAEYFNRDNYSTDGSALFPNDGYDVQLTKFVFCPRDPTITTDDLTPSTQTICENGLVDQIIGEKQVIDGSTFPTLYQQGTPLDQPDIELEYQWQVSNSSGGPWTDIPGAVAQQQNYTPPPSSVNQYYHRLTKMSDCCGGTLLSTSSESVVIVGVNTAPTVDAGGTFYSCSGTTVTLDATVTGSSGGYMYDWNDGAFTIEDPMVSATESTVYTLLVTDANGCKQADQATLVIYEANAGEDASVCEGVGTTIGGTALAGVPVVASGGTPPASVYSIEYSWAPITNLSCSDCPNPTAAPSSNTDYTLTVTINAPDGSSCSSNDMVSVSVYSAPSDANFAGVDRAICLGETIQLGAAPEAGIDVDISSSIISQTSVDGGTATVANLTDNDFSTGGHTADDGEIVIDLGSQQLINTLQVAALSGFTNDDGGYLEVSVDGTNYTLVTLASSGFSDTELTTYSFTTQNVRYIRYRRWFSSIDVSLSELKVSLEYVYVWTPGLYITTNGSYATFDAGNLEMPATNPVTYTVTANIGECNFYDQVTVAVIEARADEDYCGPRTVGEIDRSPNVPETFTWVKITDPSITTGTGDFTGAMDEAIVPVSASVGGDIGYELTTSYTLNGSTAICKDTVIVPPTCGPGCDVVSMDGGCPDFDDGNPALQGIYPNDQKENWTVSWTTSLGMVGLDNYDSEVVHLTDNVDKRVYITFTSVIDPSFSCTDSIDVNSAVYSVPTFTAASPFTTCPGIPINIGDPASDPGLSYAWSNAQFLDDATISYPEATVNETTEFSVTVTDVVTGCRAIDTVQLTTPDAANAGPDLLVCDNGVVEIGANQDLTAQGYTYSWTPVLAAGDYRNGNNQNSAQPEIFIAASQTFVVEVTDPTSTCITTDTMDITVESLPPTFTLPDLDFCPSSSPVTLGVNSGGVNQVSSAPNYTYSWSPATVSDGTAINPTVNTPLPSTSTTYEVVVRNTNGCNVKATQTINPTITPPLTNSNQTICVGESVSIGDASNPTGGGEIYNWSPTTDLDNAASSNPTFTPSVSGTTTFTVTKTVGGCSSTAEVTILVNEATAPTLTPKTICAGEAVQIGTANNALLSYSWSPTTDLDNAFISNPTFWGTISTNYTLTVIDGNGCSAKAVTSVTVNPAPAVTITMSDTVLCDINTSSIVLNPIVSPVGNYAYQWSPSTNLSNANALNPTLFITGEGSAEFLFSLIDQGTGCTITDTLDLVVEFFTPVPIVSANVDTVCAGENANLSVTVSESNVLYQWQSSTTDCITGFTNIVGADSSVYVATGIAQETFYRVIVTDLTGECRDTSDCVTIAVTEPTVNLTDPADVCADGPDMSFTATPTGGTFSTSAGVGFTSNGAAGTATLDVSAAGAGTYTVTYDFTDGNGCVKDSTVSITIIECADLSLMKTVSNATPNVGDTITFTITVANAGPNDATNVAVEDYLPVGYSDIHNISNAGTQTVDTLYWAGLTVTNDGNITLTFDAIVDAPTGATDEYENIAQVTASDQYDPDSSPDNGVDPDMDGLIGTVDTGSNDGSVDTDSDDDSDNEPVLPMSADLSLAKTVSDVMPFEGDTITFTITVANAGPNDATNVAVEDYLSVGYSDIHNISNAGTQTVDTLYWAGLTVTNSDNITLTFDAVVNSPTGATDEYENVAQVTASDQYDSDSSPDNGVDPDMDGLIGTVDTGSNDGSVDTDSDDDSDNEPIIACTYTITARDTSICAGQPIDLSTLVRVVLKEHLNMV